MAPGLQALCFKGRSHPTLRPHFRACSDLSACLLLTGYDARGVPEDAVREQLHARQRMGTASDSCSGLAFVNPVWHRGRSLVGCPRTGSCRVRCDLEWGLLSGSLESCVHLGWSQITAIVILPILPPIASQQDSLRPAF